MPSCLFCRIINKEIPSNMIYEDDAVIAILDISQATKGHTLVMPKSHAQDITTVDALTLQRLILVVQKVSQAMIESDSHIIGLNVVNNCKEGAGQSIMHLHFHLIPRYRHDDYEIKSVNHMGVYTPLEMADIANNIKAKLR